MHANVSSDAVAEDTTPLALIRETNFINSATERHVNTIAYSQLYWPALFLSFFSIIGVFGNLLVCLAIATERRLQNRTNWFLFSLALADLLVSGLVIPLAVIKEVTGIEKEKGERRRTLHINLFRFSLGSWILGSILCDLWIFLDVCSCTSSIMHIVVISIDRYLAINDPLNTRTRQQKCKVLTLIILIWSIAILLSSPMIVLGALNPNNIIRDGSCSIYNQFFVIYGSVISFVIPLIIVIIMYALTVRRLKEQIRQCQTQLAQEQLARAASLVAKPFLRRHIPSKSAAAAAAAAANTSSSQSTPISASAVRRLRLRRQQTSIELSEGSADNISIQQQQPKQQPPPSSSQAAPSSEQESLMDDKPAICRDITQQLSTKFSPHTEYACPKNPFCQLKCTCDHHQQVVEENQVLETVFEPESNFSCFKHLRCCKATFDTPSIRQHPPSKSRPISLPVSSNANQSSTSSNRSTSANTMTKNWRRVTITPSLGASRNKPSAVRNEQKAVKVLGVVFVIFVIAWCPFCIMNILQGVCERCPINRNLLEGFVWLGYVSSTINPLVYTIFNRNFRLKFIALLKCHCLYSSQEKQFSYYQSHSSLHGSRLQRKNGLLQNDIRRFNHFREQQELKPVEPSS